MKTEKNILKTSLKRARVKSQNRLSDLNDFEMKVAVRH